MSKIIPDRVNVAELSRRQVAELLTVAQQLDTKRERLNHELTVALGEQRVKDALQSAPEVLAHVTDALVTWFVTNQQLSEFAEGEVSRILSGEGPANMN